MQTKKELGFFYNIGTQDTFFQFTTVGGEEVTRRTPLISFSDRLDDVGSSPGRSILGCPHHSI